jgi:uncharacterized protein YjdB
MKKLLLFAVIGLWISGCASEKEEVVVTSVQAIEVAGVPNDTIRLDYGDTYQLQVSTTPADATSLVKYVSSNQRVFTVDAQGLITGTDGGYGTLSMVAPNGDAVVKLTFTVVVMRQIESINTAIPGTYGRITTATGTITSATVKGWFKFEPHYATITQLRYESDNPAIATIDPASGLITGQGTKGVASIRAYATDGSNKVSEPIKIFVGYNNSNDYSGSAGTYNAANDYKVVSLGALAGAADMGAVATASSVLTAGEYDPNYVLDNKRTSGTTVERWVSENDNLPQWLLIDLKQRKDIYRVYMMKRSNTLAVEVYTHPSDADGVIGNSTADGFTLLYSVALASGTGGTNTRDIYASTRYVLLRFLTSSSTNVQMVEVDLCTLVPE